MTVLRSNSRSLKLLARQLIASGFAISIPHDEHLGLLKEISVGNVLAENPHGGPLPGQRKGYGPWRVVITHDSKERITAHIHSFNAKKGVIFYPLEAAELCNFLNSNGRLGLMARMEDDRLVFEKNTLPRPHAGEKIAIDTLPSPATANGRVDDTLPRPIGRKSG